MEKLEIVYKDIGDIKPYKHNAKLHPDEHIAQIVKSIEDFGFNDPIAVDEDNIIIEGHGRLQAAKKLGMTTLPVIVLDGLTDQQKKAYILAHNQLTMNTGFDLEILQNELDGIFEFNMDDFGINLDDIAEDWFQSHKRNDKSRQDGNDEYNEFLDKYETKKTTDDCYTPDKVYDAVVGWVENEYNVKRNDFVRPFYPGGDYQKFKYKSDSVVVDNPPFSILAEILNWYTEHGIKFFLFAPAMTLFSSSSSSCALGTGVSIVYENGAVVPTSFLTNLEMEYRFRSSPTLYKAVKDAMDEVLKEQKKELPTYDYPDEVVTASDLAKFSKYGVDYAVRREESALARCLDAQKENGKTIFGSGYLVSERAAAERAAAHKWQLSEREREIVKSLSHTVEVDTHGETSHRN